MLSISLCNASASAASTENEAVRAAKGTAYFCRAYLYYQLVIRYGNLPILTSPTMEVVPLSNEDRVWAQIISDLETEYNLKVNIFFVFIFNF